MIKGPKIYTIWRAQYSRRFKIKKVTRSFKWCTLYRNKWKNKMATLPENNINFTLLSVNFL